MAYPPEQFHQPAPERPEREGVEQAPSHFPYGKGWSPEGVMVVGEVLNGYADKFTEHERPAALNSLLQAHERGMRQAVWDNPHMARELLPMLSASPIEAMRRHATTVLLPELLKYDQESPDSHPMTTIASLQLPKPEITEPRWKRVKADFDGFSGFGDVEEIALLEEVMIQEYWDSEGSSDYETELEELVGVLDDARKSMIKTSSGKARELFYAMAQSSIPMRQERAASNLVDLLRYEHDTNDTKNIDATAEHVLQLNRVYSDSEIVGRAMFDATYENWLRPDLQQRFLEAYGDE